jgi:hypothetical protein
MTSQVNKKKEASFTLFKNKYSDLTALVTGLHKKPLKGKVQGKKKNLPIGLAITFPAEQGVRCSPLSSSQPPWQPPLPAK